MFGGLVSENFYHGYSYFATTFACASNAMLIYIIISTHVNHVGPYRWLLASFAVIDILISLVHFALIPAIHLAEFGYIFWGYRMLELTTEEAVWGSSILQCVVWALLFYQTFVLTAFHYVYRFVMLCNPPWLSWIQRNPWRNWLTIAIVADIVYVGAITLDAYEGFFPYDLFREQFAQIMMEQYQIDLFAPNKPGFLGIVYWTRAEDGSREWVGTSLITIFAICGVFSTSGAIIGYCLIRILNALSPTDFHLQSATRHMQKQLFRALLWQTIIPTFTSYLPIAFIFVAPPITGISFGGIGTVLIMSTQIFPMVDPYLVLFFVQGYRKALPQFVQNVVDKSGKINNSSQGSTTVI